MHEKGSRSSLTRGSRTQISSISCRTRSSLTWRRTAGGSSGTYSLECEWAILVLPWIVIERTHPARDDNIGEGEAAHGHVVSISVLRSYRRLGLAKRLMIQSRTCFLSPVNLQPRLAGQSSSPRGRAHVHFERRTSDGGGVQRVLCHAARPEVEPCSDRAVPGHARLSDTRDGEGLLYVLELLVGPSLRASPESWML